MISPGPERSGSVDDVATMTGAELVNGILGGRFDSNHGVRVAGIRVDDAVIDLSDVTLGRPLRFDRCQFSRGLRLGRTVLGGLLLRNTTIGLVDTRGISVEAPDLHVSGSIRVLSCSFDGSLDLRGARTDGTVVVADTTAGQTTSSRWSLDISGSRIGGSFDVERSELRSGLSISSGRIGGQLAVVACTLGTPTGGHSLDARGVHVEAEFRVDGPGGSFDGSVLVTEARIGRGLGIGRGVRIGATYRGRSISANGCQVGGTLWIESDGTVLDGSMHLRAAVISGRLNIAEGAVIGVDSDGNSIKAHRSHITNELWVRQHARLLGGIELLDAVVGGPVIVDDATIGRNRHGTSVYGTGLNASAMYFTRSRLDGCLRLPGSRLRDHLSVLNTQIGSGDGESLVLSDAAIDQLWLNGRFLHRAAEDSRVIADLSGTKLGLLDDTPDAWEGVTLRTSGLSLQRLPGNEAFPLAARTAWLATAESNGHAEVGVYRAVAGAYALRGDDGRATDVLIEMRRRHSNWLISRLLAPIGQGFKPQRALYWLVALLIVATGMTALGADRGWLVTESNAGGAEGIVHSDACSPSSVPCPRPALYALDTVLPVIDVGATSVWQPDADGFFTGSTVLAWTLALAALLGWAFGGLFLFGILNRVLEDTR